MRGKRRWPGGRSVERPSREATEDGVLVVAEEPDELRATVASSPPAGRRPVTLGAVVAVLLAVGAVVAVRIGPGEHAHAGPASGATATATKAGRSGPVPASCPERPPEAFPPWASYASPESLFPDEITAMRLCVYGTGPLTGSALLGRPAAQSWARRFNALAAPMGQPPCPVGPPGPRRWLVMLSVSAAGAARPVVGTIHFGNCGLTTNGRSTRLAGMLLDQLLASVGPGGVTAPSD